MNTLETPPDSALFREAYMASQAVVTKHEVPGQDLEAWGNYGRPIEAYEKRFAYVLAGDHIADWVEAVDDPLVIDLMAPSDTLAGLYSGLQDKPTKRGIAVSLVDQRAKEQRVRDARLGIEQYAYNLAYPGSWDRLEENMDGRKANVIIEAALGGTYGIPNHELYYKFAMERLWRMLSPDHGHLLIEIPDNLTLGQTSISMNDWVKSVRERNIFIRPSISSLYLRKDSDAPLPLPG